MMGERVSINLHGVFRVTAPSGADLTPKGPKARALLAVLALSDDHRATRVWLRSLLWEDRGDEHAAGSLRQMLCSLKKELGSAHPMIAADRYTVWLEPAAFAFTKEPCKDSHTLLQGFDIRGEAFEDWLREKRQFLAAPTEAPVPVNAAPSGGPKPDRRCLVIFECETQGSLDANVAAMFFSEQLFRKLTEYDVFACVGPETMGELGWDVSARSAVIVRIAAIANRDEVWLGVQIDSGRFGPRLGNQSVVLPYGMARLMESTELGRLVQQTTDILLEGMKNEALPEGAAWQAMLLTEEAKRLTFRLDRKSLAQADQLLVRAYELDPRGQILGWRAFLRNTAFFQHRTSDIFAERHEAENLSLLAMSEAPRNALVQAFSAQLDYVNQGNLAEPLLKARRAVELDRTDPLARALLSNALTVNGRLSEGYEVALQSVSLAACGRHEFYFHHFACMAATAAGNYQTALVHARHSTGFKPDFVSPRRYEVALAEQLGDRAGVRHALAAMRKIEPEFEKRLLLDPSYPVNTLRRLPIIDAIA